MAASLRSTCSRVSSILRFMLCTAVSSSFCTTCIDATSWAVLYWMSWLLASWADRRFHATATTRHSSSASPAIVTNTPAHGF